MTWASNSLGRTVTRTGGILKKQIWIWPIIAILLLSTVGFLARRSIETTMKSNLESELKTLLNVETEMLKSWYEVQASNTETLTKDRQVRDTILNLLVEAKEDHDSEALLTDRELHDQLRDELATVMDAQKFVGYFVANKSRKIISSSYPAIILQGEVPEFDSFLTRALDGEIVVSAPFESVVMMKDKEGRMRVGEPSMYACAPIRNNELQIVAALAMQIRPDREFTRILQLGELGNSGETYAFNSEGLMVSNSRFDEELILLGLLPDVPNSKSILHLMVRDPQVDMTEGFRPSVRRSELPLTHMANDAISSRSSDLNSNTEGYHDYRGVDVVGAWKWLPKYEIGVATEMEVAEAFRPLTILRRTFWGLYGLLILTSIAIFGFTIFTARLRLQAQKAAIEAQQLGQYTLEEKMGSGAMGVVFKGHHAMLRRPTAIKMLDVEKVNEASIERFEREVQITCQLNHPNTIAIYDYGRTPEGVFYYAMEFLDGLDLQQLIDTYGPQPEGRVIQIMTQICGSLYEAHSLGLVHRDIKPANVMLNRRGCETDVVKVLDFGLVRALDDEKQTRRTSQASLTGTPLYMSPESIQTPMSVDGRSDIYSVGALGYFLLTGEPVFNAQGIVELCQAHVAKIPDSPSKRLGKSVSPELESALLACLEKSRAKRPQTARDLAQLLERCPTAHLWSLDEAEGWWGRHERAEAAVTAAAPTQTGHFEQTIVADGG